MPTLSKTRPTLAANQKQQRRRLARKVLLAIVASLLVHGLLLVVLGWVLPHWPRSHLKGKPLAPLQLTILPSGSPTPSPSPSPGTIPQNPDQYMRTLDEQKAAETPKDPNFISDKDTLAASEKPATGNVPMPTQEGRDVPEFDFETRNYTPGKTAADTSAEAAAAQAQPRTPEQPAATPPPASTPKPRPPDSASSTPPPDAEMAAPKAQPSATPEPPIPTPEKPDAEANNTPPPPVRPTTRTNPPVVPNPGQIRTPGYQPETRQSKYSGNINNRGRSAVQAIGTPMGRYIKSVQDSIGALWHFRTDQKMDVVGIDHVVINFHIDRNGKARRIQVTKGSREGALSSVSTGAILDADIPPIPPDLLPTLAGGELEMEIGFETY